MVNKVTTWPRGRGLVVQRHRGYTPVIYWPGVREPERLGTFHQKAKAARETGERYVRRRLREERAAAAKAEADS